jgi:putrescine aminotransferase
MGKGGTVDGTQPRVVSLDEALASTRTEAVRRYADFINPDLVRLLELVGLDRQFMSAQGCVVWDAHGDEYLDFLGGYGAVGLGHNHPEVRAALERVAAFPNILQVAVSPLQGALAESLAAVAPPGLRKTFLCNSGAEAVEGALKLARAATGRSGFVSCEGSFHGKTFGALSVSGRRKYQAPFEPLLPGCRTVPYGDVEALQAALAGGASAAFIVEPVQGEGGIVVPPDGYLAAARRLCDETGTLLVADEIQTGFARTGAFFACEHDGVAPDIMTVAKTFGGGAMPIGAFIATDEVWARGFGGSERCTIHTSTFGGNARACAAGLTTIAIILRDDLPARAARLGELLLDGLREACEGAGCVREARGRGLMAGVEFAESRLSRKLSSEYFGAEVAAGLLRDHHIITAYTFNNPLVIRFEPPLTVTEEQIERAVDAFRKTLRSHGSFARATVHVGLDMMRRKVGHSAA